MNREEFSYTFMMFNRMNRQLGIIKAQNEIIIKELAKSNDVSLKTLLREVSELDAKFLHEFLEDSEDFHKKAFGNHQSDI